MLRAILLAGLLAAPLSSAAMFVPARRRLSTAGAWPASRRFVFAVLGTLLLDGLVVAFLRVLDVSRSDALVAAIAVAVASLFWMPATRRWNARAHLCWASCLFLYVGYLAFILDWTLRSHLGVGSAIGGIILWLLELVAGLLASAYLWELCDALGTEHWRRRIRRGMATVAPAGYEPFVSLHVPAHNEPPEMVIETLTSLLHLDYTNYEIIAIDDNSDDPQLWQPVDEWCARHGVKFVHLSDWPGYKSGALNVALRRLTNESAELIAVVDSDYQIEPQFLRRCTGLFADPHVGFIQAPQDYRDWAQAPYYRRLYYSYKYFFAVSQPSRNERDAAIFAGTMGLIRKSALESVGGWDEWCITEDAELSLRLLRAGWSGLHVDESWGHGVMPLTFEALKSQRYRWCFGGIQILRMHWRSLLPGRSHRGNRLTLGQRWGYFAGGLQWYGDLLGLLFFVFLLAGAVNLATGGGQLFRKLTAFLVAAIPVLDLLGLIRAVALIRRGTGATWRDAIGAFFIWQSTSLAVARASAQGLFARQAVFLRTPKTFDRTGWWQVVRTNWGESLLAVLGLAGIAGGLYRTDTLSGPLLAGLLVVPTFGYAAAPLNSLAAQRAALPPELQRRRRTESLRDHALVRGAVAGGAGVTIAAAAVIALLLVPSTGTVHPPHLVGPRHPHNSTPTPTPSGSPTTSAPSSGPGGTPTTTGGSSSPSTAPTSAPSGSTSAPASPTATSTSSAPPSSTVSSPAAAPASSAP